MQPVGVVGRIAALDSNVGILITRDRRHVEIVQLIGTVSRGDRTQVVLNACLKLDISAFLPSIPFARIGQHIHGLTIERQGQALAIIGTCVGGQIQAIKAVGIHREVEVGGQVIDRPRIVATLQLDARAIGDIGVHRHEGIGRCVRHPKQVDIGSVSLRSGHADSVTARLQIDQ